MRAAAAALLTAPAWCGLAACAMASDPSSVSAPVGGVPPPTAFAPAASSAVLEPPQPPAAAPDAGASAMAIPDPIAFACTDDTGCGTHRCNLAYGKCAFPCATAALDCAKGMSCVVGICVPPPPPSSP
jgi:hypothetical protein